MGIANRARSARNWAPPVLSAVRTTFARSTMLPIAVQRAMVALEQREAGGEPRLRPPEHGKVVEILDLVVLLEAAERPPQVVDQPGLQPLGA